MTLLLTVLVFLIWVCALVNSKGDVSSPSVLITSGFLISVFVYVAFSSSWGSDVTINTVLVISGGLISFILGEAAAKHLFLVRKPERLATYALPKMPPLANAFFAVLVLVCILDIVLQYQSITNLVSAATADPVLGAYRQRLTEASMPFYLKLFNNILIPTSALLSAFVMVFYKGQRKYWLVFALCCLASVLTSNRSGVLCFAISLIVLWLFKKGCTSNWSSFHMKLIVKVASVGLLVVVLFSVLGTLTGKIIDIPDAVEAFGIYAGASIALFDQFLNEFIYSLNNFGSETLYGVSGFFNIVGFDLGDGIYKFLPFSFIGDSGFTANTYTGLRRLIHDYNYGGAFFILFSMGFLYSKLYQAAKSSFCGGWFFPVLLYALVSAYLVLEGVDELFFFSALTVSALLMYVLLWLFSRFFGVKELKRER